MINLWKSSIWSIGWLFWLEGDDICEYNCNLHHIYIYIYIYIHTRYYPLKHRNVLQHNSTWKPHPNFAEIHSTHLRICRRFREVPRLWRLARRPSQLMSLTSLTRLTWCPSSRHVRTHLMRTHPWSFLTQNVLRVFFVEGGWRCCFFRKITFWGWDFFPKFVV